jgi:AbrB family looped-hinge helix DNA binding protein
VLAALGIFAIARQNSIDKWEFPPHFTIMVDTVTLDSTGRVVIPKGMREELNLAAGDALTVETDGERVTLSPIRPASPMRKKNGIWVFHSGEAIPVSEPDRVLQEQRRARDRMLLGPKK